MDLSIDSMMISEKNKLMERWEKELATVKYENQLISIAEPVLESANHEFMTFIFELIELDRGRANDKLSEFAARYIREGWPLNYFLNGLKGLRRVIFITLSEKEKEISHLVSKLASADEWIDCLSNQLVHDYSGSWEDIFEMQKLSLLELSTPIIPVFDGVTVMPLIGTIDTARAKLIMEHILQGVINHQSQVVLIDITGVPVVDTMVAHHIIQVSEAVRLLGTTCILVGIRPEIAQTIVALGIDLSQFPTKSTLKSGIVYALELTNKKIIDI